jgi:hypothetical protein
VTGAQHPGALAGPAVDWSAVRRMLVVRPDNLGDVVMCGPALRALRRAAPDARLDLLTSPAGAAVAPLLPEVSGVLTASVSWQQLDPAAVPVGQDEDLVARIAGGGYDAAVILTSFSQSPWPAGYLCRLAGVPGCPYARQCLDVPPARVAAEALRLAAAGPLGDPSARCCS